MGFSSHQIQKLPNQNICLGHKISYSICNKKSIWKNCLTIQHFLQSACMLADLGILKILWTWIFIGWSNLLYQFKKSFFLKTWMNGRNSEYYFPLQKCHTKKCPDNLLVFTSKLSGHFLVPQLTFKLFS